jgi:hypothetical protein
LFRHATPSISSAILIANAASAGSTATRRGLKITRDYEPVRPVAVRLGQALRHEHALVGERRQRYHVGMMSGWGRGRDQLARLTALLGI